MSISEEERLRRRLEASGGRGDLGINDLLSAFGVRKATPQARRQVEAALVAAGIAVEPSLESATPRTRVTLELVDRAAGAGEAEDTAPAAEDPDGVEPASDDLQTVITEMVAAEKEVTGPDLAGAVHDVAGVSIATATDAIEMLERDGQLVTGTRDSQRVYRVPAPDPWSVPAPEDRPRRAAGRGTGPPPAPDLARELPPPPVEAVPAPEPGPAAGPEAHYQSELESEPEPEPYSEPELEAQPPPEPEPHSDELEAQPEPEPEPYDEPELEAQPAPEPEPESEPEHPDPTPDAAPPPAARRRELSPLRRWVANVLAVAGILLVAEAVVTVLWKEPFTAFEASQSQDSLASELRAVDARQGIALTSGQARRIAAEHDALIRQQRRMAYLAQALNAGTPPGKPLGRIRIPWIGIDAIFVQGTGTSSLEMGPAHYTETSLPGQPGTVGIAGHRTTYGAWFRNIDDLKKGDKIVVTMPYGRFTYTVERQRIVPSAEKHAFDGAGYDRLVLSACHPLFSATDRILVEARLTKTVALGAARSDARAPAPAPPSANRPPPGKVNLGTRDLGPGSTGDAVRALQRLLHVQVTGYYGTQTQQAVTAFQRKHNLPAVGKVGPQTRRALTAGG
ncbi:MAG: sortase [Actinobacteria bacterium]|nr:sortase [Actinomycetota bacterium]